MTDSPRLPPEEEHVRRLLADARHDGPVPPEVVARLDETLASLVSERGDAPLEQSGPGTDRAAAAPVVDLGARRRRTAGLGLLAAAAVVVAGVALGQALPRSGGDDASSSGGVAAESDASSRELGGQSDDGSADSSSGGAEAPESLTSPAPRAGLPTVSLSDPALSDRLLGLRRDAAARTTGQPLAPDVQGTCLMRGIGPGRRLLVEVDGQPGTVVYQPPSGDAQRVAIFVCGTGEPVRTLTLPAP
ncbi:hypothetical protein ACS3YM_17355 [Nocardia sp. N13]|uniref:hypothetical protein n=1 Tax=Nocardioides sp. N13(2025) TaxID=3453405 RepID=UPI003F76FBAB